MKNFVNNRTLGMRDCSYGNNPFNVMKVAFSPKAFEQIKKTIGSRPAESGGALFGKPDDLRSPIPYIREFVFDNNANTTHSTYTINTPYLNPVIHDKWDNHGLELDGIIHSHPKGCRYPSIQDLDYFHHMHTYMERPFIITPIIHTQPDGGFKMFCYLVGPDTPAIEVEYCIMDEAEYAESISKVCAETATGIDYSREAEAVDIDKLKHSKLVIVGTGGMYNGAGYSARCGIGEIVAIDPDTVDNTNLCRQGYLPRQVGMKKVDALGEHIKEINPEVEFKGYPVKLQDLTPEQEREIFTDASLAIFTTDSFDAQAYGNKMALKYRIPAIWGGYYEKSRASEIFFYIPGVTPACFRCAVSPRYKVQEDYKAQNNGQELRISSNCNTIFHSALLDAQIGMLAMAILHNKTEGKTFSGWFGDSFDRNFIQTKIDPSYSTKGFNRVFAGAGDSAFTFESYWQHISPEVPPMYELCLDCHGGASYQPIDTEKQNVSEGGNESQGAEDITAHIINV